MMNNEYPNNFTEVLMSSHYDEKADVFSFGISMFEVLTCMRPYSDNIDKTQNPFVFLQLVAIHGVRPGPIPDEPAKVIDLIQKCWEPDPRLRPSMKQVYQIIDDIKRLSYLIFILTVFI